MRERASEAPDIGRVDVLRPLAPGDSGFEVGRRVAPEGDKGVSTVFRLRPPGVKGFSTELRLRPPPGEGFPADTLRRLLVPALLGERGESDVFELSPMEIRGLRSPRDRPDSSPITLLRVLALVDGGFVVGGLDVRSRSR